MVSLNFQYETVEQTDNKFKELLDALQPNINKGTIKLYKKTDNSFELEFGEETEKNIYYSSLSFEDEATIYSSETTFMKQCSDNPWDDLDGF